MTQGLTPELFISPDVDLNLGDPGYLEAVNFTKEDLRNRWKTQLGVNILARWRANNFDRTALEQLVGKVYGHLDIRGIPLFEQEIRNVNLSDVEFYCSDLHGTLFDHVNLSNTYLSETNLNGTRFEWCRMDSVLIDSVDFNEKTSFVGVNLSTINFNLAVLL